MAEFLEESLAFADEAPGSHTLFEALASEAGVGSLTLPSQVLSSEVLESILAGARIALDGDSWHCWVLSTTGFFPSVYSNFDFNSFAHFMGLDYAASEEGIFEIGGGDDDGEEIHTGILFHPTAFRNTSRRKFRKVFVNAEGEGILLEARTDTGSRTFVIEKSRAHVTRDLRGMKWQFAIADFEAFDFFEAFQTVLSR